MVQKKTKRVKRKQKVADALESEEVSVEVEVDDDGNEIDVLEPYVNRPAMGQPVPAQAYSTAPGYPAGA